MALTSRQALAAPFVFGFLGASAMDQANEPYALNEFKSKFRLPELEITRNEAWTWSVRPSQPTIGSTVLSLNRPCPHFGGIGRREGALLSDIVGVAEERFRRTLRPDRINYLMLMMVDHQVHFHVVPRYSASISWNGRQWDDPALPGLPDLSIDLAAADPGLLAKLKAELSQGQ